MDHDCRPESTMRRHCALVAGMFAAVAASAAAQSAPPVTAPKLSATTPGECASQANDWRNAQMSGAMEAMTAVTDPEKAKAASARYSALYAQVGAEAKRVAAECATQFKVETIPTAALVDLAALYTFIGDTANNRRATERALAAKDLTPRLHAQALMLGANQELARRPSSYFGIVQGAERYVSQIDQLPDSLADMKLTAHKRLLDTYEYLDVDDGLRHHANAIIDLGRR